MLTPLITAVMQTQTVVINNDTCIQAHILHIFRVRVSRVSDMVMVTIRYDSVYLMCSNKLMGSQLSLLHGINKKLKCETKNKMISMIGPVRSSPIIVRQSSM